MLVTMKRRAKIFSVLVMVLTVLVVIRVLLKVTGVALTKPDLLIFTKIHHARKPSSFLIHPKQRCVTECEHGTVILVLSKASHTDIRRTIRQTWANSEIQQKYNLCVNFLVGMEANGPLRTESDDYGDIIQVDIKENYDSLTDKTIAAFHWVTEFCNEATFFFKVDDDVYINIANLHEIQQKDSERLDDRILGQCSRVHAPHRAISKWTVSYEEYPFEIYPPFCLGPGYLMTSSTAHRMYQEMCQTRKFKLEDVYVGMVAYRLGISVQHIDYFIHDFSPYSLDDWLLPHFYMQCSVVLHYATKDHIKQLWDKRNEQSCNTAHCTIWGKASCIFRI